MRNLRQHLELLEAAGKLVRVTREINKDQELMPLVRWQFRGLDESQRRAFLFENVVGAKGERYATPVVVGCLAASAEIYALGLGCQPGEILERWLQAQQNPILPELVDSGPAHEEIHMGSGLLEHGGLAEFPWPISTPGFDNAPYTTASHWITKDPENGSRNVGNYRGQIKAPLRMGAFVSDHNHIGIHWKKCRDQGIPLEAALVIGVPPMVAYTAVARVPIVQDELAVAGGLAGGPLQLVKCLTVNLEAPAEAEIVIEGRISTHELEPEAPFGEYTGYMGSRVLNPYFEVTCITHRRNPIVAAIMSQLAPSESSKIKQLAVEGNYYKFLKKDCNIPGIRDVAFHEIALDQYCVIQLQKSSSAEVWQALHAMVAAHPLVGKFVIAVDEDIDPRDPESVNWAMSFRTRPAQDILVIPGKVPGLDPSGASRDPGKLVQNTGPMSSSAVLIDATRKWDYPPVSLPRQEFMERTKQIWEELELPPLKPRKPWHGYSLGAWTAEDEEEARLAVQGDYFLTGEKTAGRREQVK